MAASTVAPVWISKVQRRTSVAWFDVSAGCFGFRHVGSSRLAFRHLGFALGAEMDERT